MLSVYPGLMNFFKSSLQGFRNIPVWIMLFHFSQITIIANMVTNPIGFIILIFHRFTANRRYDIKCFQYGARVVFAAAYVINLSYSWRFNKFFNKTGYVI